MYAKIRLIMDGRIMYNWVNWTIIFPYYGPPHKGYTVEFQYGIHL